MGMSSACGEVAGYDQDDLGLGVLGKFCTKHLIKPLLFGIIGSRVMVRIAIQSLPHSSHRYRFAPGCPVGCCWISRPPLEDSGLLRGVAGTSRREVVGQ